MVNPAPLHSPTTMPSLLLRSTNAKKLLSQAMLKAGPQIDQETYKMLEYVYDALTELDAAVRVVVKAVNET